MPFAISKNSSCVNIACSKYPSSYKTDQSSTEKEIDDDVIYIKKKKKKKIRIGEIWNKK